MKISKQAHTGELMELAVKRVKKGQRVGIEMLIATILGVLSKHS